MNPETIADKLELRAIKEGWPITSDNRKQIIERAMVRAACGDPDAEDKAAKILLAADVVNLKRQQLEQKQIETEHARKLQLIELAVKLGIAGNVGGGTGIVDSPASAVGIN